MDLSDRQRLWASTMGGHASTVGVTAHCDSSVRLTDPVRVSRELREAIEQATLCEGASLASGAGNRANPEQPDPDRTCFERDRDRIVHSPAFRRLAGKTQVVVYPRDHQRTRLTHALEVSQVATAIARGVGANATLTEAIALGHDCGHGPGGHASEDAFSPYVTGGYDHGPWGADHVLRPLNLCVETLDGIRNHSWSRPAPFTVEGEIVSWADRVAYCAHDLEDALHADIVTESEIPHLVVDTVGAKRSQQLRTFITAIIVSTVDSGVVSMDQTTAAALSELRRFNYDRIYMRPESVAQSKVIIDVLSTLVDFYIAHQDLIPFQSSEIEDDKVERAVAYVGGMTDRFAFDQAEELCGWDSSCFPTSMGRGV